MCVCMYIYIYIYIYIAFKTKLQSRKGREIIDNVSDKFNVRMYAIYT